MVIVAAFLGGGYVVPRYWPSLGETAASSPSSPTKQAVPTVARAVVSALGRIEPKGGIIALGGSPGDRLGRLEPGIEVGKWVEKGQLLAMLDSHADRLAAKQLAEIQLAEAKARLAAETVYGR